MLGRRRPVGRAGIISIPRDVKNMSVVTLCRLQAAAESANQVSATGRPEWVAEHAEDIERVLVTAFSPECPGWYRCIVIPYGEDEPMGLFSLGISYSDFARLPGVPRADATELLRELLLRLKPLPLDPGISPPGRNM